MSDESFMKRALALARRGEGQVSPNPMVGAVIVKNGQIVAEGYHHRYGEAHAEINAMRSLKTSPQGATLYVTLEPCHHHGKTPPCVESVIAAGFSKVVVGMEDPNPLVAGKSIAAMKRHGITTTVGVMEEACRDLNETFITYMETGIPFVTVKFAQTLDGRLAASTGHSQWISGEKARRLAHRLRSRHDAVLVGSGTVIQDDPDLTVRHIKGRNPIRIVIDPTLSTPTHAGILRNQEQARTWFVTRGDAPRDKQSRLVAMGIEILRFDATADDIIDLRQVLTALGKRKISSILVEGGAGIITSILRERLANRLVAIIAPKILGNGLNTVGELGLTRMDQALGLTFQKVYRSGPDVVIDGRFTWK